jgi:hypothetical protein
MTASKAVSKHLLMGLLDLEAGVRMSLANSLPHSHFDVLGRAAGPPAAGLARARGACDRRAAGRRRRPGQPFHAAIDRYEVGDIVFTDCRSDAMRLERSLARISTDSVRNFAFHVFLEGDVQDVSVRSSPRGKDAPSSARVLALDMGQPVRMRRSDCRVLTFFLPGSLVEEVFPDPAAIHARAMQPDTPLRATGPGPGRGAGPRHRAPERAHGAERRAQRAPSCCSPASAKKLG